MKTAINITHTNTPDNSPEYSITLSHKHYCKLQSMLILCYNTAPGLTSEDKEFLRSLETDMINYRGKIGS